MISMGWGMGAWGVTLNGYRVSFWGDEEVLELVVMIVQPCD